MPGNIRRSTMPVYNQLVMKTDKKSSNTIVQADQDESIDEKRASDTIIQRVHNKAYAAHE